MGEGGGRPAPPPFLVLKSVYASYQSLQGNRSRFFCVFLCKQSGERSIAPDVISPGPVDGF